MGLDYLDQMIIHSPQPWVEVNQSDNRYEEGNLEAWRALEEAQAAGKVRVIGVSNFNEHDLRNILDNAAVKPQVNQVLAHIGNTPFELIDFCRAHGMLVEAYSPIAHGAVLDNEDIKNMAARYQVSAAQLCVRYCLELGLLPLPENRQSGAYGKQRRGRLRHRTRRSGSAEDDRAPARLRQGQLLPRLRRQDVGAVCSAPGEKRALLAWNISSRKEAT